MAKVEPPSTRTEAFKVAVGSGGESDRIVNILKSWDSDGSGQFSLEEVARAAKQMVSEQKTNRKLWRGIAAMGIGYLVTLAIVLLLVIAGISVMKDTSVNDANVLMVKGKQVPIRTRSARDRFNLGDFLTSPLTDFETVETVIIPVGENAENLYRIDFITRTDNTTTLHLSGGSKLTVDLDGYAITDADGKVVFSAPFEREVAEDTSKGRRRRLQQPNRYIGRNIGRVTRCGPYPCAEVLGERPFYRPLARPYPSFT
ncbi:unnamed protein product [Vitrella brassicaformis CCMP3155]|uniref:EF-hand domain-containing protein n=2 Tax=Vitrella brassicaformis TaxID=1169539 RepID=A0A0G4F5H3_VITBC|nr:unnamed protein product [Vitrella brassicaformis CCMP3155]|eukprot:CEM07592.1 unnamed protein product [Vitrella brassicaformis CCMP3155]